MSGEEAPVKLPDGTVEQFTLRIAGRLARCPYGCGCNVFHKPDDRIYCASHKPGATFQMSDTTTIAELDAINIAELEEQRAELDAKIAAAKEKSMAGAIAAVKSLMDSSGVTLEMLGGRKARTPRAAAATAPKQNRSTKGVRIAAKYRSPTGETWSGRGLKPNWLRAELMKGKSLEDFAVAGDVA